nr:site-specific DNA-methyltransferase [uncultured Mucilaginibacter sp.]
MESINDYMPLTGDWNRERLEKLKQLFPDLFTNEGQLNIDELKKVIDGQSVTETERFEFRWYGKSAAKRNAFTPSNATLQFDEKRSVNPSNSENLIIEGENLEVLKLLSSAYYNKIKCIYIDPPYNTGGDFVYKDDFGEDKKPYWEQTEVTENGVKIDTNSETNGRYHSNWLNMMFSRLLIARQLLKDDGVIFISIDDNEVHNLRKLCEEVFGEENFIGVFIWAGGRKNDSKFISISHEYILVFAKQYDYLKELKTTWRHRKKGLEEIYAKHNDLVKEFKGDFKKIEQELKKWFSELPNDHPSKRSKHYSSVDQNGIYFPDNISWPGGGGPKYDVIHPITKKPVNIPSRGWLYSDPKKMQEIIEQNRVHFGPTENYVPSLKSYLKDREYQVPYSVLYQDGRASTKRLRSLMSGDYFEHPKDDEILKDLFEISTDKDDLILDFFGGSGTTGQAVMELNQLDGGKRKYILIQIPEATHKDSEAYKAGFKQISDITIERNKRVVDKVTAIKLATPPDLFNDEKRDDLLTGLGFKVFKLRKSVLKRIEFVPDNEKTNEENIILLKKYIAEKEAQLMTIFNQEDLLIEILLKNGFKLNYKVEKSDQFKENDVYFVSDDERNAFICLDSCIELETISFFKEHTNVKFICLERALDTTKKYTLKHYLGVLFKSI